MVHKTVLGNGLRIISETLDHLKSVSIGIWVNVGSRDERPEQNGISHFIEHMIFKGTRNRTTLQIAKELDAIGGMSNAFTGKENTCFHAKVMGKHFGRLADILSDIFLNSLFDSTDLERERQVILQEISMVEDTPDEKVHVFFNGQFWRRHSLGLPILGSNETVSAIKRKTILESVKRFYGPENVVVAAAGNIEHNALVLHFSPLFDGLNQGKSLEKRVVPKASVGISHHEKSHEQVHVCLGAEAPSLTNERRFACALFNTILGGNMSSRLFQEIRENRGLAYSIYSFLSPYCDSGVLGIYLGTDGDSVNPALGTINQEIRKIQDGDLSQEDLTAAKEHIIGGIYLSSENPDNRMMRLAKNEFVFGRYVTYDEVVKHVEQVTLDEVTQEARTIFRSGGTSLVTLGPFAGEKLNSDVLQF